MRTPTSSLPGRSGVPALPPPASRPLAAAVALLLLSAAPSALAKPRGKPAAKPPAAPAAAAPAPAPALPGLALLGLAGGEGVDPAVLKKVEVGFLSALMDAGRFAVLNRADVAAKVGAERQQRFLACESPECSAELSQALGVPWAATARIGKDGAATTLSLRIVETVTGKVAGQAARTVAAGEGLTAALQALTAEALASVKPPEPEPAAAAPAAPTASAAVSPNVAPADASATAAPVAPTPAAAPTAAVPAAAPATATAAAASAAATPATPPEATPAVAAEPAAPAVAAAPPAPVVPKNRSLEYAKELLAKGRVDDALAELATAQTMPRNTPQDLAEIHLTRAAALLARTPPDSEGAADSLVELLHVDPDAAAAQTASDRVKAALEEVRAGRVVVLHDRPQVARPDRPVRLRARVNDPGDKVDSVVLGYRPRQGGAWNLEPLRRGASGWAGDIRSPDALAPPGITDGFFVDYYLAARDAAGTLLDSNGSAAAPIVLELTTASVPSLAGEVLDVRDGPPPPKEPPPPPPKPWYLRWYSLTAGGVVVAAIIGGTVYALARPEPLQDYVGQVSFP